MLGIVAPRRSGTPTLRIPVDGGKLYIMPKVPYRLLDVPSLDHDAAKKND